ncbi:MAG: Hsp70 family protein [Spirochaetales bacterium]|nr:Hsp70 family protein [Spirochaetales bacterium]
MSEKSAVNIGLRLADGSFYPIFDEEFRGTKRVVLTTVHDNQTSVQIDIYKGMAKEVFEDAYIGSLVIENLAPVKKGAAEIELVIGIDSQGNLNATGKDLASGEQQALSVSLESLAQRADYDIPEFEIDKAPVTVADDEPAQTVAAETPDGGDRRPPAAEKKRSPALAIVLIILGVVLLLAVAAVVIWFFFPDIPRQLGVTALLAPLVVPPSPTPSESPSVNELSTPSPSPEESASVPTPSMEPSASPVESPSAEPSPSPQAQGKGEWYTIVRGDTLWDLSRRYYRDPFLYMKIADAPENNIHNPDLIFADQRLFIPDK